MKYFALCAVMLSSGACAQETAPPAPAILPAPAKMEVSTGTFTLSAETLILADDASAATAQQLVDYLKPATGWALKITRRVPKGQSFIALEQDKELVRLGKEGYHLNVTPQSVNIVGATQAGVFYGVQTLRQLLPAKVFGSEKAEGVAWNMPCVSIEDKPRFAWRGLMLDSGHDFQSLPFVYRFIDTMAAHKFNIFHWHLTDLGTWSWEVKGRPKLQDAATRGPGVKPGYYTQEQIREVVRYAAARHITIVPEIDMPGHEPPAIIAYPELDCPLPRQGRPWQFCVGNEKTYQFLEEVLTQVVDLFPGEIIHIGGDECPKDRWLQCPVCKGKMQAENLKNGDELQSYFIKRIGKFLATKNKRIIGWDEILEGGLAPNATVMSWRGMNGGITAAKAGHDVVMAPTEWTYFDYPNTPVEKVYSFEPIPAELNETQAAHILGAQAQMWTDHHPTELQQEGLVYPRAVALSEVIWSPKEKRNYDEFLPRLRQHLPRLAALGVRYKPVVNPGILVGRWGTQATTEKPATYEWPIEKGISGPGVYEVTFQYEKGKSRLEMHSVEIVQDGKVLAIDKHFGFTGAGTQDNIYRVELKNVSNSPLTLRAAISTDWGPESFGRITIAKVQAP